MQTLPVIPSDELTRRKADLEGSLDKDNKRSRAFGVVVVLGLIIEFAAIAVSFFYEPQGRIIDSIGLLLVTIGVAGEIRCEFASHRAEGRLRLVSEELSRIAEAEIKERDERIAGLQRDAALANERAEAERMARLRLQREVSGRGFTKEEYESLSTALISFEGQVVVVTTDTPDLERVEFAKWIGNALRNAKWQTQFEPAKGIGGRDMPEYGFPAGVFIQATPDADSQEAGRALMRALHAQGKRVMFNLSPAPSWLSVEISHDARGNERRHGVCRIWVAVRDAPPPVFPDLETT